ncbi:MAG: protein phosphatase 2C domain-containing protein [Polyangiales bacterium]
MRRLPVVPAAKPQMPFVYSAAAASFRSATQDRVAVHDLGDSLVVVVADGAGGIPGGAIAADAVIHGVAEALAGSPTCLSESASIVELLRALDDAIERMPLAGETTAVIVVVREAAVFGASCGDSSAWLVGVDDHDDLTADQHRKRRVGSGRAMPVPFERARPERAVVVVGSDGLFDFVAAGAIVACLRRPSPEAAARALVEAARPPAGRYADDVAVAVVGRSLSIRYLHDANVSADAAARIPGSAADAARRQVRRASVESRS